MWITANPDKFQMLIMQDRQVSDAVALQHYFIVFLNFVCVSLIWLPLFFLQIPSLSIFPALGQCSIISNISNVLIQKSKKSGNVAKAHILPWQQPQAQDSTNTLQMVKMHPSGDEPSTGQGVKCIKHINPLIILPFLWFTFPISLPDTPVIPPPWCKWCCWHHCRMVKTGIFKGISLLAWGSK